MNKINDFKNDLLKRREVKIVVSAESNPGFEKAGKIIADEFKSKEEVIAVRNVKGKFGRNTFLIDAMIYESKDDKDRIEQKAKPKKTSNTSEAAGGAK